MEILGESRGEINLNNKKDFEALIPEAETAGIKGG